MSSNEVWSRIGSENPFFGVLTDEKYLGSDLNDELRDTFYQTGEVMIGQIESRMKVMFPEFAPEELTVVDFGCGVGRLLIPLARRCRTAIGIDISKGMLAKAKDAVARSECKNVHLLTSIADVDKLSEQTNWIFSSVVFQHIPVEVGYEIFDSLLSTLGSPAYLTVQFTIFKKMQLLEYVNRPLYLKQREVGEYQLIGTRMSFERFTADGMAMYDYDLDQLAAILIRQGFRNFFCDIHEMGVSEAVLISARRG